MKQILKIAVALLFVTTNVAHAQLDVFFSSTTCSSLTSNRQEAYNLAPLDSIIMGWIDKGYYPGVAICVVKDDSVIFNKTYKGFTPDTKVYVASAGKWVATAVIGVVVDRTDPDWDDPVAKWIPEFKNDSKGSITLRRLLSHTSGVRPYLLAPRVDNYNHLDSAMIEILPIDTVFTSGTRFEYGGLAMQIAGRTVRILSSNLGCIILFSNSHLSLSLLACEYVLLGFRGVKC